MCTGVAVPSLLPEGPLLPCLQEAHNSFSHGCCAADESEPNQPEQLP